METSALPAASWLHQGPGEEEAACSPLLEAAPQNSAPLGCFPTSESLQLPVGETLAISSAERASLRCKMHLQDFQNLLSQGCPSST